MTIQFLPKSITDDLESMAQYSNIEYLDSVLDLNPVDVDFLEWDNPSITHIIRTKFNAANNRIKHSKSYAKKIPIADNVSLIERLKSLSPLGLPYQLSDKGDMVFFDLESDLYGGDYNKAVLLPEIINHSLRCKGHANLISTTGKYQLRIGMNKKQHCFGCYNSKHMALQCAEIIIQHYRKRLVELYGENLDETVKEDLIKFKN